MNEQILADIHNKLTVPTTALKRPADGEKMPKEFFKREGARSLGRDRLKG